MLTEWYNETYAYFKSQGIEHMLSDTEINWNCDETKVWTDGYGGRCIPVWSSTGQKYVGKRSAGTKFGMTVTHTLNACGDWMPPTVLVPTKRGEIPESK